MIPRMEFGISKVKKFKLHAPAVEKDVKDPKDLGGTYPLKHTLHTPPCILWTQH